MAFRAFQIHVALHWKSFVHALPGWIEQRLEQERERVGLWAPVALGSGISAWFWLNNPVSWLGWIGGCCLLAACGLWLPRGSRMQRIIIMLALLSAAGGLLVWGKALLWGEKPMARAAMVELSGTVDSVQAVPAQQLTRLLVSTDTAGLPQRIRVNLADADRVAGLGAGATIHFRAYLMPPAPPAVPGAYDFAQKAYFDGIGASGRILPPVQVLNSASKPLGSWRQRLFAHIRERLPGGEGAIAATLATGDTGAISEADADAMRRSGLAHLLSISGLHVSALIGAAIFLIARLLALSRRIALHWPVLAIASAGGALAGIGYTLLTGAQVPTVRSCVAALLVLGGLALGREAISLRLVAVGALIVLLLWPEALVGPSFQMSFVAVMVIIALAESRWFKQLTHARSEAFWRRAGRSLVALFITGIAVEAALLPIALTHFHQSGLLGAFANLVAIPLTTFVVMPFEALALLLDSFGMGAPAWWVVGKALWLLLKVAHITAAQAAGVLALPLFGPGALVAVMGGLLWLILWISPLRWWGLLPMAAGLAMMARAPAPDLLVTGDGRHLAVRGPDGRLALLRGKAGDYVRDTLGGVAGEGRYGENVMAELASLPHARCSRDVCAVDLERNGRRWRIMATRTREHLPWAELVRDCAAADIVVSDRRLPRGCTPRWLKLDRTELARQGGAAVYLEQAKVVRVHDTDDRHPWVIRPAKAGQPQL